MEQLKGYFASNNRLKDIANRILAHKDGQLEIIFEPQMAMGFLPSPK